MNLRNEPGGLIYRIRLSPEPPNSVTFVIIVIIVTLFLLKIPQVMMNNHPTPNAYLITFTVLTLPSAMRLRMMLMPGCISFNCAPAAV